MLRMQSENLKVCINNKNENWMNAKLDHSLKWTRQAIWGYRLFDFWNAQLGVAVEVDGAEHDRNYDNYRDEYNFRRSGIVVLRVRNKNEDDALSVIAAINNSSSWSWRRTLLNIEGSKSNKKINTLSDYSKNNLMFLNYMLHCLDHRPYWYTGEDNDNQTNSIT